MKNCLARVWTCAALLLAVPALATAADGLDQTGKPDLKSAGPLAFGPKGVLFVGDPQGAAIFAIGVTTDPKSAIPGDFKVDAIDAKIAALLGTTAGDILINDMAIEPNSKEAFLSITRGRGAGAAPAIVRVDGNGKVSELSLDKVSYAKVAISNPPPAEAKDQRGNNLRQESITDLAFVDGRLFIAGLSNEEFASKLRALPFPFSSGDTSTSVEIYHGAHGKFETRAPVRTFVPFNVGGEARLLAAYTCTPLVSFSVADLKPGAKLRGTTIAELGNRNRPIDIVAYDKDGKSFLLLANSARGVMKIRTDNIDQQTGITEPVRDTAGLGYDTIADLKGVEQLDKLDDKTALLLTRNEGTASLAAIALP